MANKALTGTGATRAPKPLAAGDQGKVGAVTSSAAGREQEPQNHERGASLLMPVLAPQADPTVSVPLSMAWDKSKTEMNSGTNESIHAKVREGCRKRKPSSDE